MLKTRMLILGLGLALLSAPEHAFACSCLYYSENDEDYYEQDYKGADIIFQGVPTEVYERDSFHHYRISAEKVWKGHADALMEVITPDNEGACGISLPLDKRVIVFASKFDGTLITELCSGTRQEEGAEDLIAWLNSYEEEEDVPPEEEEEETSEEEEEDIEEEEEPEVPKPQFEEFLDVPEVHPNSNAISFVKKEGIVEGYPDGTYKPNRNINRAEFTKIIIGATFQRELIDTCKAVDPFSDVTKGDWFSTYTCVAVAEKILNGYPDGTFKPQNFVNFAEAAKIVTLAFSIETDPEDHLGVWWRPYVFALARIGSLPTSFTDPNQQLTRGDMAEIIYRVMMGMQK